MCVCANLCRVQGVGEDGADWSLSWRQTGIFSGMLVFLCHLGWTWKGQCEILEQWHTNTHTHTGERRQTHKGPNHSKVLDYYPQILAIRKGQSLSLPPSLSTILSASLTPQHDKWPAPCPHSHTPHLLREMDNHNRHAKPWHRNICNTRKSSLATFFTALPLILR